MARWRFFDSKKATSESTSPSFSTVQLTLTLAVFSLKPLVTAFMSSSRRGYPRCRGFLACARCLSGTGRASVRLLVDILGHHPLRKHMSALDYTHPRSISTAPDHTLLCVLKKVSPSITTTITTSDISTMALTGLSCSQFWTSLRHSGPLDCDFGQS
ncbi:hypothetical protein BKA70DRAFT_346431 [Coprinopsis sp. MPI-PUGE-AT-0042]|nr:hypothetical protein BKA70DRAFT_346431 [Coprinopsis sp. MPI-PUGE-AT-0042]